MKNTKVFIAIVTLAVLSLASEQQDDSLPVAKNIIDLKAVPGIKAPSSKALETYRSEDGSSIPLQGSAGVEGFVLDFGFGDKTFSALLDTGSSDLWLPQQQFQCVNTHSTPVPLSKCRFGPLFKGTVKEGQIMHENFNISYGDGEFLTGMMGYEDVTVGNITIEKQEVALANYGHWDGDGSTSGLFGFAFPSITNAYKGDNPKKDTPSNNIPYKTWIINAIEQNLLDEPIFSLALLRGPHYGSGQLGLGGVPDIPFNHTFSSVPLIKQKHSRIKPGFSAFNYYAIKPDGYVVIPAENSSAENSTFSITNAASSTISKKTNYVVIVDSGTPLTYLPSPVANALIAGFSPSADTSKARPEVDCNAKAPQFAITIGGANYFISPHELILQSSKGKGSSLDKCLLGVVGTDVVHVLGATFLKNVVAVFDVGRGQMRFAPHEEY